MTILEYYKNKQKESEWVERFQSTAQDKYGKIFNCLNVNFRSLKTYYIQLDAFKEKDGLRRSEWNDFQETGQEKDKHRVSALKNAKFLEMVGDRFFITDKGRVAIEINESSDLTDREKWLLMYMLIIDYQFGDRELDIIKSVVELSYDLGKFGITASDLIGTLKDFVFVTDKRDFFKSDIFWLISFAKDEEFIRIFLSSPIEEKEQLFDWVVECSNDRKTRDCIARKFIPSGAYTGKMFNEDINIILCTLILVTLQDKNYDNFINLASKIYEPVVRAYVINDVVQKHSVIFNESYTNSIGEINKMLKVED